MKVLLVEDDASTLALFELSLKTHGRTVGKAQSGPMALDMATHEHYDAAVIDHFLTGPTGLETLQRLRQIPGYAGCPVVIMTAASGEECERIKNSTACFGPAAVLQKPFSCEQLLAALDSLKT